VCIGKSDDKSSYYCIDSNAVTSRAIWRRSCEHDHKNTEDVKDDAHTSTTSQRAILPGKEAPKFRYNHIEAYS